MAIVTNMAEALNRENPEQALGEVSMSSEALALELARELSSSLVLRQLDNNNNNNNNNNNSTSIHSSPTKKRNSSITNNTTNNNGNESQTYPIPLPRAVPYLTTSHLQNPKTTTSKTKSKQRHSSQQQQEEEEEYQTLLKTLQTSTNSILSSLTRVASGGSQASSELRNLETQRRSTDAEADDIQDALQLRQLSTLAAEALGCRRYADATRAIADYHAISPSERAVHIAGVHTVHNYRRTRDVLCRTILERYEDSVSRSDVRGLSELTPLLGMLQMADKGVGLYLKFSQSILSDGMEKGLLQDSSVQSEQERMEMEQTAGVKVSRAEQKRREEKMNSHVKVTVCTKLAKVYNAGVTHLRHHLPMVAYALGEADGDAALVQLVHLEVEKRVVRVVKQYLTEKGLAILRVKADRVSEQIEDKYINGTVSGGGGLFDHDPDMFYRNVIGLHNDDSSSHTLHNKNAALELMDDCGFKEDIGPMPDVDASMEELALLLQHTESYERFIRHAVVEVKKARTLRTQQAKEERKRKHLLQLEKCDDDVAKHVLELEFAEEETKLETKLVPIDVLPPHTQLNEVVAEVGGYYSGLERALLLAGMQRAFLHANHPDDRNYSPLTILSTQNKSNSSSSSSSFNSPVGCRALQTSVVEECLYAAQRSTLRAFATGHTGTAAAAANYCNDTLGRVLLEVLSRRADAGISNLKPGDGLLPGAGGSLMGQAALTNIMSSAQKNLTKGGNKMKGAVVTSSSSAKSSDKRDGAMDERLVMKERVEKGIARACATMNDLEVAVDYTRRLEARFLQELESSFPPNQQETEQLKMCIKSLVPVTESFRAASDRAVEQLIGTLMMRVRSIVNESVGQESATAGGFSTVMGGGSVGTAGSGVGMNYHLDDEAFELSQISEGYIGKLCSHIDELVGPLRLHLAPKLSDALLIGVLVGASKRLEASIRRSQFTALGALALDSDIRFFLNFAKERFDSPELTSNVALYKACNPLARLAQIALLMNVDDLEDVLDLISSSKRKNMWDLSLNDAKAFLNLRVDFEGRKVNELLQISDVDD